MIGERIVTPGAIVQLLFKLRLTPPTQAPTEPSTELTPEQRKQEIREEDAFLTGKEDTAELLPGLQVPGYVHAPYYPAVSCTSRVSSKICYEMLTWIWRRTVNHHGGS